MTRAAYDLEAQCGAARAGTLTVRGKSLATPAFLPVGTYGAVKGLFPSDVREQGAAMVLANACHLHDRPGADTIAALGGLHAFMNWDGLILTDSGGFQVFSMLDIAVLDDDGVTFRSPLDGRPLRLGPDEVVDIQLALDSDIAMVFDHCPPLPASRGLLETAVARTTAWAKRAVLRHNQHNAKGQALFAIVQGGLDDELRRRSAEELCALPFDGWAAGGLSVGEGPEALAGAVHRYAPLLPSDRLRYLMGVGRPDDVLEAIAAGFDVFDCVYPTRNGRHGSVFTREEGKVHLRNRRFRDRRDVIDASCPCPACAGGWSVATLRHLVMAQDPLGRALCSLHNLRYLHDLVAGARAAIVDGTFERYHAERRSG